jgi:hypothetical protein
MLPTNSLLLGSLLMLHAPLALRRASAAAKAPAPPHVSSPASGSA